MPSALTTFYKNFSATPLECNCSVALCDARWVFRGHFPAQPLLPGVIQLMWVRELAEVWFKEELSISGVPQMKFVRPLTPDDALRLTLTREDPQSSRITFLYELVTADGRAFPASQGKVQLEARS